MEWTVVAALAVLVPIFVSLVKPIVSLTQSITRLTTVVEKLEDGLNDQTNRSREAHKKLWKKNEEQDKILESHDRRLHDLDGK